MYSHRDLRIAAPLKLGGAVALPALPAVPPCHRDLRIAAPLKPSDSSAAEEEEIRHRDLRIAAPLKRQFARCPQGSTSSHRDLRIAAPLKLPARAAVAALAAAVTAISGSRLH